MKKQENVMLVQIDGVQRVLPVSTALRGTRWSEQLTAEGSVRDAELGWLSSGEEAEARVENKWVKIKVVARVYDIPEENLEAFTTKFEKLVKTAAKLGAADPSWREIGSYLVDLRKPQEIADQEEPYYRLYHQIIVEGEAPKIPGWTFLGTIESDTEALGEGMFLIRAVPGKELPKRFKDREKVDPRACERCSRRQRRKVTYIVQEDATGQVMQVGSECIKDYLGHTDPKRIAAYLEMLNNGFGAEEEEREGGGGGFSEFVFELMQFLPKVRTVMRLDGWLSRGAARAEGKVATADTAWLLLLPARTKSQKEAQRKYDAAENQEDKDFAAAALAWSPTLWTGKDPKEISDYIWNLQAALSTPYVTNKTAGLAASLLMVYAREQERAVQAKLREQAQGKAADSRWLGKVGQKLEGSRKVTVLSLRWFESMYGAKALIKMLSDEGDQIVWWYSGGEDYTVGTRYSLNGGEVVKHDEFRGVKETTVKRVGLVPLTGVNIGLTAKQGELVAQRVQSYHYGVKPEGVPLLWNNNKMLDIPRECIPHAEVLIEWLRDQGKGGAKVAQKIEEAWDSEEYGALFE